MYSGGTYGCVGTVDCSRNIVTSYAYAGESPGPMCYNPNNNRLYWSTGAYTGTDPTITVFDCADDSVVKRIPVIGGVQACQLHASLNKLYAESYDETLWKDVIYVIDCNHDSVTNRIILHDDVLKKLFLVPGDSRLWYLGVHYVIAIDCVGDSIVADAIDNLGSIDDACACPEDRKIYTSDGQVIDMDNPAHVESVPFWANRFCYVPSAHKLYGVVNDLGHSAFRVLDTQSDTVTATFNGPCQVSGMCLDHTGDYIYCAGYEDTRMLVIGVRVDSVVAEFSVPVIAAARDPLAVNRRTHRIYEAEYDWHPAGRIPVVHDSVLIGIEEFQWAGPTPMTGQTILRRGVPLTTEGSASLYDVTGRVAAALRPGLNAVSGLTPGVYFMREKPQATGRGPQAVKKIVVVR